MLLDAPKLNMTIAVRTTLRSDYSYFSNAAIRINEEIFEVSGWGDYLINGVATAGNSNTEELALSGHSLTHTVLNTKQHIFELSISDTESISFKTFKDWISVKIVDPTEEHFSDSVGLFGNFYTGEKLGRDRLIIDDDTDLGSEWQVRDTELQLFASSRAPQYPEICRLPSPSTTGRRLTAVVVSREDAEQACADWGEQRDECIDDVIRSGYIELAETDGY